MINVKTISNGIELSISSGEPAEVLFELAQINASIITQLVKEEGRKIIWRTLSEQVLKLLENIGNKMHPIEEKLPEENEEGGDINETTKTH